MVIDMDLKLNDVLHLTQEEIGNSKIEFNMQAGSGGQPFFDRWLKHTEEEKKTGTCSDCSYWGWYGKQRNFCLVMGGQLQMCYRDLCHYLAG